MFAAVAFDIPVAKTFDYQVPGHLLGKLRPGHLVLAPFKTSTQPAIVVSLPQTIAIPEPKEITDCLHPDPLLSEWQLALAVRMAEQFLAPIGQCIWMMLPSGIAAQRDIQVTLNADAEPLTGLEHEIVLLLRRRGTLRGRQLDLALPGKQWRPAVDRLVKSGVLKRESILLPARVRPKTVQTASLAIAPRAIDAEVRALERPSRSADMLEAILEASAPDTSARFKKSGAERETLNKLVAEGWLVLRPDDTVALARPAQEVREQLAVLRKTAKAAHILRLLAREGEPVDVTWIYAQADCDLAYLRRLEAADLIILGEREVWRDSLGKREFVLTTAPMLTAEQSSAWSVLKAAMEMPSSRKHGVFLLQGVTGSGKTELYLRTIGLALARGSSAIFLVPEIALTAQTVRRVAARFPGQVAIIHSGLSEGERYDTWRRARAGLFRIAVGPRSALFTPLPDVEVIILDEEHDHSYKQTGDQYPPHYHARDVAEMMMKAKGGIVILGSATPSIEVQYRAEKQEIGRLELPNRIMGHRTSIHQQEQRAGVIARYQGESQTEALTIGLPDVMVVDMRSELKAGNTSIFSRTLQEDLRGVLARREQALLLMNRRGQATYVFCRDCGYVANCPHCDAPLTHHRVGMALRCHRCGHIQAEPVRCPQCSSTRIKYFGAGTQQVEQTVKDQFPNARVIRWDADSASTPGAHESILQHFIDRYADIVVGTQMIAKGLDLPLVTLVGIISADVSLNLPDFRAAERSFQLLTQAAGRAGRGLLGGKVVLQTYQPDHYVIQAAATHDTKGFYRREIAYRRDLGYPPFRRLVRVLFLAPQDSQARAEAERASTMLKQRIALLELTGTELIGPAPCFFSRVNQMYRWQVLLRGPDPTAALRGIDLPGSWRIEVDPLELL
jgi:primosomal protein N' (replication factor Y)